MIRPASLFILLMCLSACNDHEQRARTMSATRADSLREPLIRENRNWARTEDALIGDYISRKQLDVIRTGTGLRYTVYRPGSGLHPQEGDIAEIKYTITLLDGTFCYRTAPGETLKFQVGQDNIESGLHEGIQHLRVGDKALFIIPSYLAHGLTGDLSRIPPRSPIVVDLELAGLE